MNKKIQKYLLGIGLTSILLIGSFQVIKAQEAGYFDHHYLQPVLINPGATGFNGDHEFLAAYKLNYTDFPGAPRTFTALYNGSFADKVGLGFQILSDHVGVTQLLHAQLNYSYRFIFNNAVVGVGLSTGIQNFKVTDIQNDPLIDPTDVLLNEGIDGYLLFDGSAGVYAEVDKKFIFGISFPNVVKQRIAEIAGDVHIDDLKSFPYAVHFGYRHEVKNYNFEIEPSITIKDLRYSPFLIDLNLKFSFLDEQLIGGLGYTLGEDNRAALLLGTRLDNLKFYYSYDVSIGDFQQFNNGSHEFTLVYQLPSKSKASE
ncbi:MAG: PorP/SprF family type IX secretion system membrane protein [Saprospiraceae bacterium]